MNQEAASTVSLKQASKHRLLVVEDAKCIQRIVVAILKKMNFTAEIAENGEAACEMVKQSKAAGAPYDMIFMDMQMPRMTGLEAVRWLRQHEWSGPIVAMSVHANEDCEKFLAAGCNAYIAKPISEEKLREAISQHMAAVS